jgi:hypothetical protein
VNDNLRADTPDSLPAAAFRVIRGVFLVAAVALAFALAVHFALGL